MKSDGEYAYCGNRDGACGSMIPSGSALYHEPAEVRVFDTRCEIGLQRGPVLVFDSFYRVRRFPLSDFRMSIGKAQSACAAMIAPWEIQIRRGVRVHETSPVINAVRMLVDKNPGHCGRHPQPGKLGDSVAAGGFVTVFATPHAVHGHAANPGVPAPDSLGGAEVYIRGAFENANRLARKRSQQAPDRVREIQGVRIIG